MPEAFQNAVNVNNPLALVAFGLAVIAILALKLFPEDHPKIRLAVFFTMILVSVGLIVYSISKYYGSGTDTTSDTGTLADSGENAYVEVSITVGPERDIAQFGIKASLVWPAHPNPAKLTLKFNDTKMFIGDGDKRWDNVEIDAGDGSVPYIARSDGKRFEFYFDGEKHARGNDTGSVGMKIREIKSFRESIPWFPISATIVLMIAIAFVLSQTVQFLIQA